MSQGRADHLNNESRVLLLSMRNLKLHVSRSTIYEFEDVISNCDTVDILAPACNPNFFSITNKLANETAKVLKNGKFLKSLVNYKFQVKKEYDLFFFFCQSPQDILVLNSIQGWREKCRYAVCWLDEIWIKDIEKWKAQLQLFTKFDCLFMNLSSSTDRVANLTHIPCYSIPFAVDAIKFCPYPRDLYRCIDVLNIGRRSQVTHQALLEQTERDNFFYIYDSIKDLYMTDYRYHRSLYTNFVKRSRYIIVNKAKFDLTGQTNPQEEVGPRFFEGAAAGAIMLGVSPKCEAFARNFDWSDSIIEIPFDCSNIAEIIADLNAQPERQEKMRNCNIVNSLLRHDWIYRWEEILATVGLDSTPQILQRKAALQNLAEMVGTSNSSNQKAQLEKVGVE
jgi:Glycosyl transferases group 1